MKRILVLFLISVSTLCAQKSASFVFDGQTYLLFENTKALNNLPVTIQAWVKPYLRKDASFFPTNVISNDNPGKYGNGFALNTSTGFGLLTIEYNNGFRNVGYNQFLHDNWYHITIVYDFDKVVTYVDGKLADSLFIANKQIQDGLNYISFGRHNSDTGYGLINYFIGEIDEVGIWNKAFDRNEVVKSLNQINGNESKLVHYITFDSTKNGSIKDEVTNRSLTLYGNINFGKPAPVGVPEIKVSENKIDFGDIKFGEYFSQNLIVENIGEGILIISPSIKGDLFSIKYDKSNLKPGEKSNIEITAKLKETGVFKDSLLIKFNSESNNAFKVIQITAQLSELFWNTIWFRIFAGLLFIIIGPSFYYWRILSLKKKTQAQEIFARKLMEVEETERKRIAQELHDSLSQNVLLVKNRSLLALQQINNIEAAQKQLTEITKLSSDILDEVRELSHNLRPIYLDRIGLTETIKELFKNITESTLLKIEYEIENIDNVFQKENQIIFFRIIQELTNNILKHADAKTVSVTINTEENKLRLFVQDDGKGYEVEKFFNETKYKGIGLHGIIERVKILKGDYRINSESGSGTIFAAYFPKKEIL